ncbi:DUF1015 domain-containing protein [Nitrospirota bacterium]
MTEVIPFRGIHYNREKVSGEDVLAPPYDVISPEMKEALYSKSPHNIIQIDAGKKLPEDDDINNRYTRAAELLGQWQKDNILTRDEKPTYYLCRMEYTVRGEKRSLTGFFGLVRLVELGKGVFPHEATHSKPKKDRLSLMTSSKANTSPIYSLYNSETSLTDIMDRATAGSEYISFTDPDGSVHRFWIMDNESDVEKVREALDGVNIFIADGHHRYETAIEYQRHMHEAHGSSLREPYDYVLMFLADINDPGLAVLPTHRVVTVDVDTIIEKISKAFEVEELPSDADFMKSIEGRKRAFGLYDGEHRYRISCKDCAIEDADPVLGGLDVSVLHKIIFGQLLEVGGWGYEMEVETTLGMVDEGEYDAAFFLNPTEVKDVEAVASKMLRMPPKSTYFYPKVQTGFLLNSLTTF